MDDNSNSDISFSEEERGERLEPLGAPNDDEEDSLQSESNYEEKRLGKLDELEDEQEVLNSALFALTTHFAQVQLRLRQISNTPPEQRGTLLSTLEEFAAQGLPDLQLFRDKVDSSGLREGLRKNRLIQKSQLKKLKRILEELEIHVTFLEKDEGFDEELVKIKSKFNDEYCKYVEANAVEHELRSVTYEDNEIFVKQLKMQVDDLEQFISYLKIREPTNKCVCSKLTYNVVSESKDSTFSKLSQEIVLIVHFLAIFQMRCVAHIFKKTTYQNSIKSRHWGDLRAKLEISIYNTIDLITYHNKKHKRSQCNSEKISCSSIIKAIRGDFVPILQKLLEHGSKRYSNVYFLPWNLCFSQSVTSNRENVHVWEILIKYYHLSISCNKKSITKKLAESFNLSGNETDTNQNLLSTIESIESTHSKYKKDEDLKFKAFICASLNSQSLVAWLRLIFQSNEILKQYYQSWSYVASTGLKDSLNSLDALSNFLFNLPVDIAIYNLENIDEAFI